MNARTGAGRPRNGIVWHPADGSHLSLKDAMQDSPTLPARTLSDYPTCELTDAELDQIVNRVQHALHDLAVKAIEHGDAITAGRAVRELGRVRQQRASAATGGPVRPASSTQEPEVDLSGLSIEELRRLADGTDCRRS